MVERGEKRRHLIDPFYHPFPYSLFERLVLLEKSCIREECLGTIEGNARVQSPLFEEAASCDDFALAVDGDCAPLRMLRSIRWRSVR